MAIVTNAGGPGIACADACAAAGLRVEPLGAPLQQRLRRHLPAHAAVGNPVDMIASATPEDFRRTIERLAAERDIDAVVAIFIPPLVTRADDVAAAVRAAGPAAKAAETPLLAVFMAATDAERMALTGDGEVPVYGTPEEAVRALGHVARYAAWRRQGPDPPPALEAIDADAVAAVLAHSLAHGGGWLDPPDVDARLRRLRHPAGGVPARDHRRGGRAPRGQARRAGGRQGDRAGARPQGRRRGRRLGTAGRRRRHPRRPRGCRARCARPATSRRASSCSAWPRPGPS